MQKIPLHLAKEGMVLAREICRNDSTSSIPVCGKDVVLTSELIARLGHMDINSIYVQGHPVRSEGDHSLETMLGNLEHRFEKVRNDPLMSKVYDIYANYLKRTMGDDGGRQA